jgi:hypothetical protein|tara:strand:+ start:48 stop:245 length:198 start_codon:yes stop_codon:yes gene_type:complete
MIRKFLLIISTISSKLSVWSWNKLWSNRKKGYGYRKYSNRTITGKKWIDGYNKWKKQLENYGSKK